MSEPVQYPRARLDLYEKLSFTRYEGTTGAPAPMAVDDLSPPSAACPSPADCYQPTVSSGTGEWPDAPAAPWPALAAADGRVSFSPPPLLFLGAGAVPRPRRQTPAASAP